VPNWRANRPVSACIWSRPVNSANFFGSVARILASRSASVAKASSHSISTKSPSPRAAPSRRLSGRVSRAGEYCFMIPELPLAQITPWFSGWSGLPSM
jgi:hypothetical protein